MYASALCQVYASALPCAYAHGPPESDWEPFARLVLRAAYEAMLAVGAVRSLKAGGARVKCYLTVLGGGAFGNKDEWIRDAIRDALDRYQGWPLHVVLVHYGSYARSWARLAPRPKPISIAEQHQFLDFAKDSNHQFLDTLKDSNHQFPDFEKETNDGDELLEFADDSNHQFVYHQQHTKDMEQNKRGAEQ